MDLREEITNLIKEKLNGKFDLENLSISFSEKEGVDFQTNFAFLMAKKLNKKPFEFAEEFIRDCHLDGLQFSVAMPGFINIKVSNELLSKFANIVNYDEMLGVKKVEKARNILIDYGGANVAKELHVGHLRSPIIGEALKRLHIFMGDRVVSDTHLGDWGIQMGLTILQLKEDGYLDQFFQKDYKKAKLENITLDTLNEEYPKASKRKDVDENFKKEADEITLKMQKKEEPYYSIYQQIRALSVEEIKKNYSSLNAYFDFWYGESDAEPYINKVIDLFVKKGLAKESDGALIVEIAKEGEHIPIPKKSPDEVQRYKNPMPPAILKK